MGPSFRVRIGVAYHRQGFLNVPVDMDRYIDTEEGDIVIELPDRRGKVTGRINRRANSNGTARVLGGVPVRDWIQENFEEGDHVQVTILAPRHILLERPQSTSQAR